MPAGRVAGGPLGWLKAWAGIRAGRAMARRLYDNVEPTAVSASAAIRRYPAVLAALRCRRQDRGARTECRARPGQPAAGRARRCDRHRLCQGRAAEAGLCEEGASRRQSGARGGAGDRPRTPSRDRRATARSTSSSPAAARARPSCRPSFPPGLGLLPAALRTRLRWSSNAGPRISKAVAPLCKSRHPRRARHLSGDLPAVLATSHLVIARAGASTIAELTVAGRPAILVPLPSAMDDHQTVNAREMAPMAARARSPAQFHARDAGGRDHGAGGRSRGADRGGLACQAMRPPQGDRRIWPIWSRVSAVRRSWMQSATVIAPKPRPRARLL
jgi:UDP-N-acetylglucosamine--N-acetylmuramyl-(pentapeptide) pyrophosphoryl-undecaprenol N-acetylglucosamine transferase